MNEKWMFLGLVGVLSLIEARAEEPKSKLEETREFLGQVIEGRLTNDGADELRAAQAKWEIYRDAMMEFQATVLDGSRSQKDLEQELTETRVKVVNDVRMSSKRGDVSLAEADADLDDHFRRLEGRLAADTFKRLQGIQLTWKAYRDAHFEWLSAFFAGKGAKKEEMDADKAKVAGAQANLLRDLDYRFDPSGKLIAKAGLEKRVELKEEDFDLAKQIRAFVEDLEKNPAVSARFEELSQRVREGAGGRFSTGEPQVIEWRVNESVSGFPYRDADSDESAIHYDGVWIVLVPLNFGYRAGYNMHEQVGYRVGVVTREEHTGFLKEDPKFARVLIDLRFEGFVSLKAETAQP